MTHDVPVHALLAGTPLPYTPAQAFGDLTRAATIYVTIRVEDRYLNIRTWPRPMLARYVAIEIECFVREWRLLVEDAEIPRLTRAVVEALATIDREPRQSTSAM